MLGDKFDSSFLYFDRQGACHKADKTQLVDLPSTPEGTKKGMYLQLGRQKQVVYIEKNIYKSSFSLEEADALIEKLDFRIQVLNRFHIDPELYNAPSQLEDAYALKQKIESSGDIQEESFYDLDYTRATNYVEVFPDFSNFSECSADEAKLIEVIANSHWHTTAPDDECSALFDDN